ncbi:Hpt domain-containing protein [Oscillatoriales cyanobacterium LEGE 11467]|uniref:Hpt domain-containing protein n=1 Tax=Zarconia navalis LEGE 11467 TaxID=1828826 RepID=A0A928Z8D8_9CYAN|nr:Hpt domain-containing protein [Zarconia navalis]MBE9039746.1 Hpt domain-containing protein [Zarconia navalis LEGE 11467]
MTSNEPDLSNFSMLDLFHMEVEERAAILNENLLALEARSRGELERDNLDLSSLSESLMRAAHAIKGAARIVQIEAAVQIAHGMEDCFVAVQTQKIELQTSQIDELLESVDWLLNLSQIPEAELDGWLRDRTRDIDRQLACMAAIANPPPSSQQATLSNPLTPEPPSSKYRSFQKKRSKWRKRSPSSIVDLPQG